MTIEFNPEKFYEWLAPSGRFTVHLSLDVARKLTQASQELGREFSAVLLGYSTDEPTRISCIDDFVLLPESWDLQGGNFPAKFEETRAEIVRKLAEGAAAGRHPIGFCRWQLSGLLELTGRDFASAQRFFAEADNVVLLIRCSTRKSEATFCYWEDGKIQVPGALYYFPFDEVVPRDCSALTKTESGRRESRLKTQKTEDSRPPATNGTTHQESWAYAPRYDHPSSSAASMNEGEHRPSWSYPEEHQGWSYTQAKPSIPIEPEEMPPVEVRHGISSQPIHWLRLVPTVAILTLVVAWTLNHFSQDASAASAPAQAQAAPVSYSPVLVQPVASLSTPEQIPLGLQVVPHGKQLEIHWNHDATVIRGAAKGVMRISDGGVQEVIDFDTSQLRDGAVAYSPKSNDVTVRFEIRGLDESSASESVRSVAIP